MTLRTGLNYIITRQGRVDIVRRENVVSAVTIVALCSCGVAEFGYFTMECLEVRFCNSLMTFTALIHDLHSEAGLIGTDDTVRLVTVVAYRKSLVSVRDER